MNLREYFSNNDILTLDFVNIENYHIYIDYDNKELCIELCDKNGNSVNIGSYVDINIDTMICDIRESILNYLIGNYLYSHC